MQRRNVQGPAGGAGLIRYFDVDEGGPKLDPKVVLGIVCAFVVVITLLNILL